MSSNSTTASAIVQLQIVSEYITIIMGFILFIGSMIGNLLNIIVFFLLGNWKHNACSLCILVRSVLDLITIFVGLSTAILTSSFHIDFKPKSRVWCKLRLSIVSITFLSSLTYVCLQSIDVFFSSSQSVALRQKSNVRMVRNLIIGTLLVWIIHIIPNLCFQEIIPRGSTVICTGTNSIYTQYNNYFVYLGLYVAIHSIIIIVFDYLTYRNLQTVGNRERPALSALSRQMISMAIFQTTTILLFQAPFGVALAYNLATASLVKDSYRLIQEQVALAFFSSILTNPFYCYCIASKRYRQRVVDVLKQLSSLRGNQVVPASQGTQALTCQQRKATTLA